MNKEKNVQTTTGLKEENQTLILESVKNGGDQNESTRCEKQEMERLDEFSFFFVYNRLKFKHKIQDVELNNQSKTKNINNLNYKRL